MYSFDVNSLFTNVPLVKTIDILYDYISSNSLIFPIPINFLKYLLLLCTDKVEFTFGGEHFQQIDGVAMGSPLGPLLADVYMSYVENMADDLIRRVSLYKRYVDDIVIICEKPDDAMCLLQKMNTAQNHISLTCEQETNKHPPFLDVLLSRREDGSIRRSIYRKPTWTGQYLNFHSYCPVQYKRGLVRCLFNRINRICTDDTREEETNLLTTTLIQNGYPLRFIDRCKSYVPLKSTQCSVAKKNVYISLPFRGDSHSFVVRKRLRSAICKTYYAAKVIIVEKTKSMLQHKPKQHINDYITSHCVYQFTCMCGHTYIGRSNRDMQLRKAEHVPKWLQKQMTSTDPISAGDKHPSSSIAKHILETNHRIDMKTAFKVLHKSGQSRVLKFIEALAIRKFKPPLCIQKQFVLTLNLPW
ncbi:unnamed protein product [Heterobilharzia americana]|nr:unnamed protein product [Heterobilharzia americana]